MRYTLVYGLISGLVAILTMITGFALTAPDSFVHSYWWGYLVILVGLTFIFVGIKRYRDLECGGVIRFGRALGIGLAMAVLASLTYVVIWEAYLAATDYAFIDSMIAGAPPADRAELEGMLLNPWVRMPFEFVEPFFPPGLFIAILSAALLRNPRFLPARGT
jgi:hypothetical protein